MGTYLQEYGNVPVGLMRVDSLRLGGAATAAPPPAAAPEVVPGLGSGSGSGGSVPPPGAGGSAGGFLGRLQRAESNDEARLSYRLSQTSARTDGSSSSRREEEEEAAAPQPCATGPPLTNSSSGAVGAEAKWMQPPQIPELRQPPPVLEPRGDEAGVEQVPLPGTPESPPPVAASRFPDDVGTPKRDHFASSFRGLSASLSGRPY